MDKILKILGRFFLFVMIIMQLVPFYIVLTTACRSKRDLTSKWIPPTEIYWENFQNALINGNMIRAILNTIIITGISVILIVAIGSLAAYPLARNRTKFNDLVMFVIVGVMMVPPLSTLVPLYSMMNRIGGINTYWGIILIMVTGQLPLAIFLFRNFIGTIPVALDEAAYIDGAGFIRIFIQIIMPLLKPVIASVIIITGTYVWNDYQMSLYMLPKADMRNIATSVAQFFSQQSTNMGGAAAAALIGLMPIVLLYILLQKHFIKGMVDSAIK
ncbi:MAG: carbohydrate ABC transporter permease [Lachnospiraceae bacterium]